MHTIHVKKTNKLCVHVSNIETLTEDPPHTICCTVDCCLTSYY